ncbi:MAG TPA: YajQ family cyclic di-GMP-binding protein [Candidatus Eremiobacteraceae bacterium]|jgi:hypothetical protein
MSDFSFDIVSKVEKQALEDAVNQAAREVATRFDLKNSKSSIEQTGADITIVADDEMKLKNVVDILQTKCVKRGVSLKSLRFEKPEAASGGTLRQVIKVEQGIPTDKAKKLVQSIKESKLKVSTQIQDEQLRVSSKSKDDLQKVMALIKSMELDYPVQFVNYR